MNYRIKQYLNVFLKSTLIFFIILFVSFPVFSQKAILPGKLVDAGGEFEIDSFTTTLSVKPYAESLEAEAKVKVMGQTGAVKRLMMIFNGGRRVYQINWGTKKLLFSHVGDFLTIDFTKFPLKPNEIRDISIKYSGKAHSVSSKLIKNFKIEKYDIKLDVIPGTGNMEATAKLEIIGYKDPFPLMKFENMPTPPPIPSTPSLIITLNNNYVINKVLIGNKEATYTHVNGFLTIDMLKDLKPNDKEQVQIMYTGKIRNSDRNRIWDNFDNAPFEVSPYGAH